MPGVQSGVQFRMADLVQNVLDKYLTTDQQKDRIKKANSQQAYPFHSIVRFFASLMAKENDPYVRLRRGSTARAAPSKSLRLTS